MPDSHRHITGGLVSVGRESLCLHLGLGRGTMEVVCHDQGFGLLLSPGWGFLGRGTQSPGQSCLVLSQASRAWHLRGSGQRGLEPSFKASEGRGSMARNGAPRAGAQARLGRQGGRQPCLQQTCKKEKRTEPFQTEECGMEAQNVEPCRFKSWGLSWIV